MVRHITQIETNPLYPEMDITSATADILSLILQNQDVAKDAHLAAETDISFYGRSHRAIGIIASRLQKSDVTQGMHVGATTYEAISWLVRPVPPLLAKAESLATYQKYFVTGDILTTIEMFEQARSELERDCPNVSYVIHEVANSRTRNLAAPALMAAGVARKIELDILNAA